MDTERRVKRFCRLITSEVKEHLKTNSINNSCYFYYSHYDTRSKQTEIYEIIILPNNQTPGRQIGRKYVVYNKASGLRKIVYGGQNGITEKVLLGDYFSSRDLVKKVIEKISIDKNITFTKTEINPSGYTYMDPELIDMMKDKVENILKTTL